MPFDGAPAAKPATPDAAYLAFALRHPETWPEGFGPWDYRHCDSCALGLFAQLWPDHLPFLKGYTSTYENVARRLGLPKAQGAEVFLCVSSEEGCSMESITPLHVADALDAAIAARGAP